jgi:heme/copper-type cytochrome/quinol oxidase subunit 4
MEDPEVPTEHLHEDMEHHAEHSKARWTLGVALTSAFLAGLAAVSSLLAGHHANEAMVEQIRSSDKWSYYQAKGIKAAVLGSKIELLEAEGKPVSPKDRQKILDYKKDQDDIAAEASEKEHASEAHLQTHVVFARAVTLFQIAIAIGAIAALTNRRPFWFVSMALGAVGIYFLITGWLAH